MRITSTHHFHPSRPPTLLAELVAATLQAGGLLPYSINPGATTPESLYRSFIGKAAVTGNPYTMRKLSRQREESNLCVMHTHNQITKTGSDRGTSRLAQLHAQHTSRTGQAATEERKPLLCGANPLGMPTQQQRGMKTGPPHPGRGCSVAEESIRNAIRIAKHQSQSQQPSLNKDVRRQRPQFSNATKPWDGIGL